MNTVVDELGDVRRPGRPRSSEADQAILHAALEEYAQRGLDGLTVDGVAARAGVSKATIYRRYPCKADLVMAAAQRCCDERVVKSYTGDVRADLRTVLDGMRSVMLDSAVGPALRTLIGDAHRDDQLGVMHREFVTTRRANTMRLLQDAIDAGELRADMDLATAAEMLVAPVFFRFLVNGEPLDDAFLDAVVDGFLHAYGR